MKKLDVLVRTLSDDLVLIEQIKDRIRKNGKASSKVKYQKLQNGFVYVDEKEFYQWILDTYPNLKDNIPAEYWGKIYVEKETDGKKYKLPLSKAHLTRAVSEFARITTLLPEITEESVSKLTEENYHLKKENIELKKQLEEANKKLAPYRSLGRPPEKK